MKEQEILQQYLLDGENLLEHVSTGNQGPSKNSYVGITHQRIIYVHRWPMSPSDRVLSVERQNVVGVKWSGAWARLKIQTDFPSMLIEMVIRGKKWKNRAKHFAELAQEWPIGPVEAKGNGKERLKSESLDVEELALSSVEPEQYLEHMNILEEKGVIESSSERFLQRIQDMLDVGKSINEPYEALMLGLEYDDDLKSNPQALSLLEKIQNEKVSIRWAAIFLLGSAILSGLGYFLSSQHWIRELPVEQVGTVAIADLYLGLALWMGRHRVKVWVLIRAILGFVMLSCAYSIGVLDVLGNLAFLLSIVLVLGNMTALKKWLAVFIYVVGYLGIMLLSFI